jgi:hypothetical protein
MGTRTVYGISGNRIPGLVIFCCILLNIPSAVFGGDPPVTGVVRPGRIGKNGTAAVRFELDYQYAGQVSLDEPALPAGLSYAAGPFIRPLRREGKTIIEYTLQGGAPGRYLVPAFSIHLPSSTLRTAPFALFVENGENTVPLELSWERPRGELYAGQAFPVTVWANLLTAPFGPGQVSLTTPAETVVRSIEDRSPPRAVNAANLDLYNVPLASYMMHPSDERELVIPGGTVTVDGLLGTLPELRVGMLPLPEGEDGLAVYGVGDMEFTARISREEVQGVRLVTAEMVYSGEGNFLFLRFPEIRGKGLTYLHAAERQELEPLTVYPYGYAGSRRRVSTYRQAAGEEAEAVIPEVRIFNPRTGAYVHFPEQRVSFPAVETVSEPQTAANADPRPPAFPPPAEAGRLRVYRTYSRIWAYFLFLPPLVVFFFRFAGLRVRRAGTAAGLILLLSCCTVPGGGPGEFLFAGGEKVSGKELYASAYEAAEAGRYGSAVADLQKLHRLRPMDTNILRALEEVEARAGVEHQAPAAWGPHPDIFFWTALVFMYGAAVLLLFRKNNLKKALLLPVFMIIINSTGLAVTAGGPPFAVLRRDAAVLVVPSSTGTVKLVLREGTTLGVEELWNGFVQVRTGDDILGWVDASDLVIQE